VGRGAADDSRLTGIVADVKRSSDQAVLEAAQMLGRGIDRDDVTAIAQSLRLMGDRIAEAASDGRAIRSISCILGAAGRRGARPRTRADGPIGTYQAPDQGAFCGPDVSQTASYTWAFADDVLTLKAEQDACADRDSSLTGEGRRR
jgi:hypothetical protein